MEIAFIGIGQVGFALANHLQKLGHSVTVGARDLQSKTVNEAISRNPALKAASMLDSVSAASVVFLATPFGSAEAVLTPIATALKGKIVVDCTNPVGPQLSHGLASVQSGTQLLQSKFKDIHFVKSFTIYGYENFERVHSGDQKPCMLYCGDDSEAKKSVSALIEQLGWDPVDVGSSAEALHLEHMTLMWIKMVRLHRHQNFVFSMIKQ